MLAVVFWHRRRADCPRRQYRDLVVAFHEALNRSKPELFRYSAVFESRPPPWFSADSEVFEDWYVMSRFAGMDALDKAVLEDEACRPPHEQLMREVGGAHGAFYGLAAGQGRIAPLPHASWFIKPPAMSAGQVIQAAAPHLAKGETSLWTRAMAAGPAANCLLSSKPVAMPADWRPIDLTRRPVWPGA